MLPKINRENVLAAMRQFNSELRDSVAWAGWNDNHVYIWAIEHDGQRYPIKQIVALAVGVGVHTFSGGAVLNRCVARLGFTVVRLEGRAEAQPRETLPGEMLATENQALRDRLTQLELHVTAEPVRARLALTALAAMAELAEHADGCPVSPCVCGYVQAEALAAEATACTAGATPTLAQLQQALTRLSTQSVHDPVR